MKVGIMQPYFMPYIGYWQRINAVDMHIVFDDVNYIKRGWMHRNRIIINKEVHYFNAPVIAPSINKIINTVEIDNSRETQEKMMKTLYLAYCHAPYYKSVERILEQIIFSEERNFSKYLFNQIAIICEYLGIKTELVSSSTIQHNNSLHAQDLIIDICKSVGATEYYNALSGEHLYDRSVFNNNGIKLTFIRDLGSIHYNQAALDFIPSLSIIDVLMNCSHEELGSLLDDYELL